MIHIEKLKGSKGYIISTSEGVGIPTQELAITDEEMIDLHYFLNEIVYLNGKRKTK
jgi:hypothetical protein